MQVDIDEVPDFNKVRNVLSYFQHPIVTLTSLDVVACFLSVDVRVVRSRHAHVFLPKPSYPNRLGYWK
jgi:hypothetical protein